MKWNLLCWSVDVKLEVCPTSEHFLNLATVETSVIRIRAVGNAQLATALLKPTSQHLAHIHLPFWWAYFHEPLLVLQLVWKPVPAEDAPLGEYLARGLHLPVHVAALPNPLCGTFASKQLWDPGWGLAASPASLVRELDETSLCFSLFSRSHRWIWPSG